jgi:hypothetical protein
MQTNLSPVDVTPIQAATNNGPWEVAHGGNSSNQANSYPAVHAAIGKGDYVITFNIRGQGDLQFDDTPIWIGANGKPSKAFMDSHFHSPTISNGGKTLTITDTKDDTANQPSAKFYYQLNFKGGDSNHKKLDPIIINDGGKTVNSYSLQQIAEFSLAGLAIILLAVFLYRRMVARRDASSENING